MSGSGVRTPRAAGPAGWSRRRLIGACAAALPVAGTYVGLLAPTAQAHPFHVALAQAEWIRKARRVEVSLRLIPEDVEQALSRRLGRRVRLERERSLDTVLEAAVRECFRMRRPKAAPDQDLPLHWVGYELEAGALWAYFEIAEVTDVDALVVRFTWLLDLEAQQLNTLELRVKDRVRTWVFDAARPERTLRWD